MIAMSYCMHYKYITCHNFTSMIKIFTLLEIRDSPSRILFAQKISRTSIIIRINSRGEAFLYFIRLCEIELKRARLMGSEIRNDNQAPATGIVPYLTLVCNKVWKTIRHDNNEEHFKKKKKRNVRAKAARFVHITRGTRNPPVRTSSAATAGLISVVQILQWSLNRKKKEKNTRYE